MEGSRERTVATEKHVRPPQVHMNVNTCPTPPHPSPPVHIFTYWQPQRSIFFLRKFTWTLMHAPPHPTPTQPFSCVACHLQGTLTCPTPPQPLKCIEKVKEKPLPATAVQQSVSNYMVLCYAHTSGWACHARWKQEKIQYSTYPILVGHSP